MLYFLANSPWVGMRNGVPVLFPIVVFSGPCARQTYAKVHCIQLECPSQKDDQPVVLINMVVGVDVHIKLQEEHYPKDHLWLQVPLKYRCDVGRSSLWFIAKKPADYGPFIEDYKARLRDIQIAFPFAANAETLLKKPYYSSLGAFAALVSDQVDTENAEEAPELRASIVSVTRCPVQGLVIIVQVCDEVSCHLYIAHMLKHTLSIVRPNKMNRVREEPDTVVVEFTRHNSESVRIIFPDAVTGRAIVRKCGFSLSSGF
ncbi:uncharacterized protein LOC129598466 [Paramacrobiotus metropolitanus]|uniref:uncharacterized protein LOC129598466 n=1 Tax=Paramacrobiotus metropolitanus TaxID=2943436 RepID=UPI00244644E7|nr:uncharacterized protein LOC129598466 [Paramacrobiotus metropolitanus]